VAEINLGPKEAKMAQEITPVVNCRYCHGSGVATDWVPYGMGNVPMDVLCGCVEDQVEEEEWEIVTGPRRSAADVIRMHPTVVKNGTGGG